MAIGGVSPREGMTVDIGLHVLAGIVAVHTSVTVLNSLAHLNLGIVPPPGDLAFISL